VEDILAALERLTETTEFSGSSRRKDFLHHLVNETLAGRCERLKGTSIAIDVFGRKADFDPQTDAVVRSEARRLRQALDNYYAGNGADDPIRIVLPKGSYVPIFERRRPKTTRQNIPTVVGEVGSIAHKPIGPMSDASATKGQPAQQHPIVVWVTVLTAVFAALVLAGVLAVRAIERSSHAARAAVSAPSVLVVPFEARGADADAFAQGISAQLIADLMRFQDFRLYSLQDSMSQKANLSGSDAGLENVADYLVRGSVGVDDHNLSVVVRLVDTADGRVIWSEQYIRSLEPSAVVTMQAEIADEIATAIGQPYGSMLNAVADKVAAANTNGVGLSSFACVMRAKTYRQTNQSGLYAPVRQCLEEAVARDPLYADAWAMLAYLRLDGGRFVYDKDAAAAYTAARTAAVRALAIDSKSIQAMKALSLIDHYTGNFEESERLARAALALNPNDPDTLAHLGWRLSLRGKFTEGIPYLQRAIERSANPPGWYFQPIALERLMAVDMDGMLVAAERASADGSSISDALLAIAYGGTGQSALARQALDRMAKKWPLLYTDPAAALGIHQLREDQITAVIAGLRAAGWQPPEHTNPSEPVAAGAPD
jgi:TolB-like protein/tetratricopeptide (TPR) repeat protein